MKTAITDRFRSALLPHNILATAIGSVIGAAVPVAVHHLVRYELDAALPLYEQPKAYLVLAGLLFSGLSVYGIARDVFQSAAKALGFVVLLEGTMALASAPALSWAMLGILVVINAVSASVALANEQRESRREARKEAGTSTGNGDVLTLTPKAPTRKVTGQARAKGTSLGRVGTGGRK